MPRSSLALFLATAGLVAGTLGCGQAPEPKDGGEAGEDGTEMTSPSGSAAPQTSTPQTSTPKPENAGEGGEAGEAGEG
ncbi:hypothetical protein [Cyanobium sp. NIES-981]|uniref:hypothetical protein n=1 Tax=Cyanobium sp. NIES-981 TaxID=1851505 RepID=UPI000B35E2E9|nr:hypothetical protein [Cyanobium sp. NIES-981]